MAIQLNGIYNSTGFRMGPATLSDPYFANVALLLHGDGTNNSTLITDSSSYAKAVTASSSLKISTVNKKFGTGSVSAAGGTAAVSTGTLGTQFNFGTGDFTIEMWSYLVAGVNNYQRLLHMVYNGGPSLQIRYSDSGYGSRFQIMMDGADNSKIYAPNYTDASMAGAWYHIAMVRSSGNISLFINGILQTIRNNNYTGTPVTSYSDTTNISSVQEVGIGTGFPLNGYLDEYRITNGVARYTDNFTPPTAAFPDSGPVVTDPYFANVALLLHGDGIEASTTFTDSSSVPKTMSVQGGTSLVTGVRQVGTASMYYGGNGYAVASLAASLNFGTNDFTAEAWLRPNNVTSTQVLFGDILWQTGYQGGWSLDIVSNGVLMVTWGGNTGAWFTTSSPAGVIAAGKWQHVATTRAAGVWRVFVNGVKVLEFANTSNYSGSRNWRVGAKLGDGVNYQNYSGFMDDHRVTNGVARYTGNFTPSIAAFPNS
jgi:hypothetical protein